MSSSTAKTNPYTSRRGGLLPTPGPQLVLSPRDLPQLEDTDEPISYLDRVRVGNDQGKEGACSIFAIASWATVMLNARIPDSDRLTLYRDTLRDLKRRDGGLTVQEAFRACHAAGWLPGMRAVRRVTDMHALSEQPLLATYKVTQAWHWVSEQGCLNHDASHLHHGYHLVQIVAAGHVSMLPGKRWIYVENSWGRKWGWNGLGVMGLNLHRQLIHALWVIL